MSIKASPHTTITALSRADLARAPGDHASPNHVYLRWRAIAVKTPEQHAGGGPADRCRVLSDDRDSRLKQVGEDEVVESHQRDLAVQFKPAEGAKCAEGDQVLPRDKRGRWARG